VHVYIGDKLTYRDGLVVPNGICSANIFISVLSVDCFRYLIVHSTYT